jgi:hypothetical protein
MIIWGSKGKVKQIGNGTFYCPQCRRDSGYAHMRIQRYFTLYFIPLFPTETLGEAVRCMACAGEFNTSVLSLTAEQIEAALAPWTCSRCNNLNPHNARCCLSCAQDRSASLSQTASPPALPDSQTS